MSKKVLKKILALVMSLAMIIVFMQGCGSSGGGKDASEAAPDTKEEVTEESETPADTQAANETLSLAFVSYEGDIFTQTVFKGVEEQCAKLGIDYQLLGYLPDDGEQATSRMLEDALAMGVDMLVLSTQHPDAAKSVLPQFIEKGIPVVTINDPVDLEGITAHIGQDYVERMKISGDPMFKALGEGKNTLIITGPQEFPVCVQIAQGFEEAAKENGIEVLDILNTSGTGDTTTAVTEDAITRFGLDGIDSICVWAPPIGTSVAAVLENAGANPGDILIASQGGFKIEYDLLEQGWLYSTSTQEAYGMGTTAVDHALEALNSGEVFGDVLLGGEAATVENYDTLDYNWLE